MFIMEDDVRLFPDPLLIGLDDICKNINWDVLRLNLILKIIY